MLKGPNQILEEVKNQIGKNDINSAIQNLELVVKEYATDIDLLNSIISIKSKNADLTSNNIKGIISSEQYNLSRNKIINSLLLSVDNIKKNISEKELQTVEDHTEIADKEISRNEEWRKFSNSKQIKLAFRGDIQIYDPVNDFQLYYYNKKGELFKKHSLIGQLQYIELQKAVAKNEFNHKRKLSLYSTVCALYEMLESAIQGYLSFNSKSDGFWKMIEKLFRNDLIEYTSENEWEVRKLKDESHEFYNNKSKELSAIDYEQYKRKDFKETVVKIQNNVVDKNKKLENFVVAIPGEYANWFCNGYLWYCNNCSLNYTHWLKDKGDWIEYGSPILSQYNKGIFSPFSGLLLDRGSTAGNNPLWYMIPEKGTDVSKFNSSLVYGELIDYIHKNLNNGRTFSKYSETNFDELIKKFDDEKLIVTEFDNEIKELLNASNIKI